MAQSHTAIQGDAPGSVRIQRALLSVSDKTGLEELGAFLVSQGVELLSTGGTAKRLRDAGLEVRGVADYTGSPEILDGRVKSLHPKIHGGILAVRGNESHEADLESNGIGAIDLVVLNLYPFEQTVAKGADFATCMENIDIGGPAMLRAAAKNNAAVSVLTSPSQYAGFMEEVAATSGATSFQLRKKLAAAAFAQSARYDAAISTYFEAELSQEKAAEAEATAAAESKGELEAETLTFTPIRPLKYGCNPQQKPAALCSVNGRPLPFTVLNGNPGYINLLDAANAWQLVSEVRQALGIAAAASFKHVSPAGCAVAVPLSDAEAAAYELAGRKLTPPGGDAATPPAAGLSPSALAYLRARNADPMSSFGDFAALSDEVDAATAMLLKTEVSDGIIAPSYTEAALAILTAKKGGRFIVLQADADYTPPALEYREVLGVGFMQKRNATLITPDHLSTVPTAVASLPEAAVRDLVLGSIALKYTQSNSVGYAVNGQMVGVGAGQQSRVDCVKLAGRKVEVWWMRQHPKVLALQFNKGVKRQARINARVRYIEGDLTPTERVMWEAQFSTVPEPLTREEKAEWLATLDGVCLSSDAFFPFRDSIDHASKYGVKFIAQAGGSVADDSVVAACDEYGMAMGFTGVRLFHH